MSEMEDEEEIGPLLWILDAQGNPVGASSEHWAKWFPGSTRQRRVASTVVRGKAEAALISTVFLGLDHRNRFADAGPVLWETMIFGGAFDGFQERYSSKEHALQGHRGAVELALSKAGEGAEAMDVDHAQAGAFLEGRP